MDKQPKYSASAFNCPNCGAYAEQTWNPPLFTGSQLEHWNYGINVAKCKACEKISIWLDGMMIYPLSNGIEPPNEDLNDEIKNMYNEAKSIVNLSPRASAALLRLAAQLFCIQLGNKGEDLYKEIGELVRSGCPNAVQQAFDTLRLEGNKSVHPSEICSTDSDFDAGYLFFLINYLANKLITEPKIIKEMYLQYPSSKLNSISDRDHKEKI